MSSLGTRIEAVVATNGHGLFFMARKTKKDPSNPIHELDAQQLALLKLELTESEWRRIRKALMDLSCGIRQYTRLRKAGYSQDGTERWEIGSKNDEGGWDWEGWLYTQPPNVNAIRLLTEQNVGRAPARETQRSDPNVWVIHMVPGHYGIKPGDGTPPPPLDEMDDTPTEGDDPGPPENSEPPPLPDLEPEGPVLEMAGEPWGLPAVMEPEFRDEPLEED